MNDRLAELRRGAASPDQVALEIDDNSGRPGETNVNQKDAKYMQDFFSSVEIVKQNILAIRQASKRVSELNQEAVLATTSEQEQAFSSELTPIVNDTNKKAALCKQLLQRLREETDGLKNAQGAKKSELQIRDNLTNTLTRKFVDIMKEYQQAQQKYKTDIKKKVKRQVQIVKPDATTEEIDAVLKSGGGSGEVFKNAILKGEAADTIRNAYMNVADKYQDVLALEASVAELHQMFLDFALLTEQQGELLDQIEFQVKSASDFIDEGNQDMVQAIEYQKSIRKKQCCILVIVLVIIGIILAIVFSLQGAQK